MVIHPKNLKNDLKRLAFEESKEKNSKDRLQKVEMKDLINASLTSDGFNQINSLSEYSLIIRNLQSLEAEK